MDEHEARKVARAAVDGIPGARLIFTEHATRRMRQRDVTAIRVRSVLRRGQVVEGPAPDTKHGGWKCAFHGAADGGLKVVTAFGKTDDGADVVVVTVIVGPA